MFDFLSVLQEAVNALLRWKNDIKVDLPLSVNKMKVTALMVACQLGLIDIVKVLLAHNADVQALDRLRRTPLIHAAMNGNTHICTFLLFHGADPNHRDSSGNSVLHYAAAYGWSFIVELLLERGADPNAANDWKTTPLSIAFMNGHVGIVRILLASKVDVNFVNDVGVTLVMMACQSNLHPSLVEQIKLLVTELHANCDVVDAIQNTAVSVVMSILRAFCFHTPILNVEPHPLSSCTTSLPTPPPLRCTRTRRR